MPLLVFHIGLPKTATTFWQRAIFPHAEGIDLIHRKVSDETRVLSRRILLYCTAPSQDADSLRPELAGELDRRLRAIGPDGVVLISDERMSIDAATFWEHHGPEPHSVADRLAALADSAGASEICRVMIGLRRQETWLPSRYAESAKGFETFGQADFERRVNELLAPEHLQGGPAWLEYDRLHEAFASLLGQDNVLFVPMEPLETNPNPVLEKVGRFIGHPGLERIHAKQLAENGRPKRHNALSIRTAWRMRRREGTITLPEELHTAILRRFEGANRRARPAIPDFAL